MICNQFHLLDKRQRLERRTAHRLAFCSHHHHRIEPTRTSQDSQSRLLDPLDILRRNLHIERIGLNPKPRTPLQRPVAPLHNLTPRLAIQVQSVPIFPCLRLHSRQQHHTYYIINTLCLHLRHFAIPLRSLVRHPPSFLWQPCLATFLRLHGSRPRAFPRPPSPRVLVAAIHGCPSSPYAGILPPLFGG